MPSATFRNTLFCYGEELLSHGLTLSLEACPLRLFASACSLYLQLPFIPGDSLRLQLENALHIACNRE